MKGCFLRVTVRTLQLKVLNWMLLQRVQLSIFDREDCTASQSRAHLTAQKIFESASCRSFIKITNISGPRILPWGTLEVTGVHCDEEPIPFVDTETKRAFSDSRIQL